MKRFLGIVVLGLLFFNISLAAHSKPLNYIISYEKLIEQKKIHIKLKNI